MEYTEYLVGKLNKVLSDELSSSILYKMMSEVITDKAIADEVLKHSEEEFSHFNSIISFCYNHSLENDIKYSINQDILKFNNDDKSIIDIIQGLETIAIKDYREIALKARENQDIESEEFFIALLEEEQKHFDDLASYSGQKRKLSFSEFWANENNITLPDLPGSYEDEYIEEFTKEDIIELVDQLDEEDYEEVISCLSDILDDYEYDDSEEATDSIDEKMSSQALRAAAKRRKTPAYKKVQRLKSICMKKNGERVRKSKGKLTCSSTGRLEAGMSPADRKQLRIARLRNRAKITN